MHRIILTSLLILITYTALQSQRSRTRDRDNRSSRYEEDNGLKENLWYGISLGNLYFFNDFSISTKVQGGYKPVDRVSIGLQGKMYFDFINRIQQDISLFSYGGGPEVRIKISEDFFAIGEYNLMSIEGVNFNGITSRESYTYPTAGIGYRQGQGPWTFGAQLLFIFSEDARSPAVLDRAVDYWIDFNYKF
tara:strand:- start:1022 stop:1594 length:573 start_codon:yes stop_codon:yes gene_type:complete